MLNRKIALILILVLLAISVFFGIKYFFATQTLSQTQAILETQKTNDKVLAFTKLFINDVLKAKAEVSFETRLKLENAVRDLGDAEILAQWAKFTDSKTEAGAQEQVKTLLEILVNKIKA